MEFSELFKAISDLFLMDHPSDRFTLGIIGFMLDSFFNIIKKYR